MLSPNGAKVHQRSRDKVLARVRANPGIRAVKFHVNSRHWLSTLELLGLIEYREETKGWHPR